MHIFDVCACGRTRVVKSWMVVVIHFWRRKMNYCNWDVAFGSFQILGCKWTIMNHSKHVLCFFCFSKWNKCQTFTIIKTCLWNLQAHFAIDSNTKVFCKLSISQLKLKEVRLKSDNNQCCSIHFFPKEPPISIWTYQKVLVGSLSISLVLDFEIFKHMILILTI